MINIGEHNTVAKKAVSCNIKAEIFKLRDKALTEKYASDSYEYYKKYFDNYNDEDIGKCVNFLCDCYSKFTPDIYIYTDERYLCEEGTLQGITKLPNGANIVVFKVYNEEHDFTMCQVLYYDGEELKLFTPYEGNAVNIITSTCIGDEHCALDTEIDKAHPLANLIYPDGINEDIITDDEEAAKNKYMMYFGISEEDADDDNLELDWDAIDKEIISALS